MIWLRNGMFLFKIFSGLPYKVISINFLVDWKYSSILLFILLIGPKLLYSNEPALKKPKLLDIPTELLKNDPHEVCPIQIPVGADFMGKCPYLEAQLEGASSEATDIYISQCPFMQKKVLHIPDNKIQIDEGSGDFEKESDKLFCGLVAHKQATIEGMNASRELGEMLAKDLIGKGAMDVMTKAQAIVHGQSA